MSSTVKGSIELGVNSSKLSPQLAKAGGEVKSWAAKANNDSNKALKGVSSSIGSSLKAGLVGFVAGISVSAFSSLTEGIDNISKQARTLGTSTEFLAGIGHAANLSGVDVETLTGALGKFRQKVEGPLDDAIMKFAGSLEGIQDPGKRAQALVDAFGKKGLALAPMFEEGADGIKDLVAEAQKLGLAFNGADAEKVEEANDAITRVQSAFKGLFNTALIKLAPVIELVGGKLTDAFIALQPIFSAVFEGLATHWGIVTDILSEAFSAIGEVIEMFASWVGEITGVGEITMSVAEIVENAWRLMATGAAYFYDTLKAGVGIVSMVAGTIVKGFGLLVGALKSVLDMAKQLPERLRPDFLNDMIAGVDNFQNKVNNTGNDMQNWGQSQLDNFGKSAEDVGKWFDKRKDKKDEKKEKKPIVGAVEEMGKSNGASITAAIKGTKEAIGIEAKFRNQSLQNPVVDINNKMLAELKKGNRTNEDIRRDQARLAAALTAEPEMAF
jgi:hypothetical protein